jgi:hypothetical protein
MRQVRRPTMLVRASRQWRSFATTTFALLALFINTALLPALHFAAGRPAFSAHSVISPDHHLHSDGDEKSPASSGHQVCHFCRLLGVALPPPPSTVVVRISAPRRVVWSGREAPVPPRQAFRTGNLPRAPPSNA